MEQITKYTQSKVVVRGKDGDIIVHGNCLQTTIACLINMPPSEVPNFETLFDIEGLWHNALWQWLKSKGYELMQDGRYKVFHDGNYMSDTRDNLIQELQDTYYIVTGKSSRGVNHCCIFMNGVMMWDCHPTHEGLETFDYFETLDKIS